MAPAQEPEERPQPGVVHGRPLPALVGGWHGPELQDDEFPSVLAHPELAVQEGSPVPEPVADDHDGHHHHEGCGADQGGDDVEDTLDPQVADLCSPLMSKSSEIRSSSFTGSLPSHWS